MTPIPKSPDRAALPAGDEIRRLIPHAGTMCLLERVLAWTDTTIACGSTTHAVPNNPLRRDGRISAVCGIEYGLQAMAIHGALRGGARQPVGYLVRLGDVRCDVDFLDQLGADLTVRAEIVQSLATGYSYNFSIVGGDPPANAGHTAPPAIVGRATIALVG